MKTALVSKKFSMCLTLAVIGFSSAAILQGQTLEWGNEAFSDLRQSDGSSLDETFMFALGSFDNLFVPDETNVSQWNANWRVFDTAVFNSGINFFSSTVDMNATGGSSSATGDATFNFQGLQAYIWIRNENSPSSTAQWFLAKNPSWIFPTASVDCCNNLPPLQWLLNDAVPTGTPIITFNPVPEPSSVLLALLTGAAVLVRRRRA